MIKKILVGIGLLGALSACSPSGGGSSAGGGRALKVDSRLQGVSLMSGLQNAWDVGLTPDGVMLFTERCRGVSALSVDGSTRFLFGASGAAYETGDAACDDNTGFLGIAVHPAFKYNRTVYVYMLSQFNSQEHVVARFKINADYTQISDRVDIVTGLPYKKNGDVWGTAGANSGGRLRFGPDGHLYISVGDGHQANSQDTSSLGGKVMVVTDDGKVVRELSKISPESRIFASGVRNVLGLAFDSAGVIACDSHPRGGEVLKLRAGDNGGWDARPLGTTPCPAGYCGDQVRSNTNSGLMVSFGEGRTISSCETIKGEHWGDLNGMLLVSSSMGGGLDILEPGTLQKQGNIQLPEAAIRSLVETEEGLLVVTDSEIWQLNPR